MKTCSFSMWLFSAIILIVFTAALPLTAQTGLSENPFDMVVKLHNIERTLTLIDKMTAVPEKPSGVSPTAVARGILQGTDWIDDNRPIVAGITFQENAPLKVTVLIPFTALKEEFRKMVTAHPGPDYYLFTIPPGPVPEDIGTVEAALITSMQAGSETAVSLEVPLRQMIDREHTAINEFLTAVGTSTSAKGQAAAVPLTTEESREVMANIIAVAHQVDYLSLGINFNPENIETSLDVEAFAGTDMFQLFSQESRIAHLNAYQPEYPMIFRSRGFDMKALLTLVSASFGKMYEKTGIDFAGAVTIADRMTGEMAGGISMEDNGPLVEFVSVLKESDTEGSFIESVYLPWLITSGEKVPEEMKYKGLPVYEQTASREINGRKVYRLTTRFVAKGSPPGSVKAAPEPKPFIYAQLLTTVDNYFLSAPDEKNLKKLIDFCGSFEAEPAPGPLMTADVDLADYVESLRHISPELELVSDLNMPAGKAVYRIDMARGKAHVTAAMKTDDLKKLFALFQKMTPSQETAAVAGTPPAGPSKERTATGPVSQKPMAAKESAKQEESDSAEYWFKKGSLSSVYGNDRAAISQYKKALDRDTDNADYLYLLGVSYGETGQYQKALDSIDQALLIQTDGRYYYARGRVLLQSGEKTMAIENFIRAEELGSREARRYLEKYGPKK